MTTQELPVGPDPEAIKWTILETWPETDVVEALGAFFYSVDPSHGTFRDVVMPLLTEAHGRLAATRARHSGQ